MNIICFLVGHKPEAIEPLKYVEGGFIYYSEKIHIFCSRCGMNVSEMLYSVGSMRYYDLYNKILMAEQRGREKWSGRVYPEVEAVSGTMVGYGDLPENGVRTEKQGTIPR